MIDFQKHHNGAFYYLCLCYLTGLIGFIWPFYPNFPSLTPLNLMMTLVIMLSFHPEWTWRSMAMIAISYGLGFAAEAIGVNTGLVFGRYEYESAMGFQLFHTPIMAGVLWLILNYGTTALLSQGFSSLSIFYKSIIGALLMLSLDILIEPVAIHYKFWHWADVAVPIQNYIGWFCIGFVMQLLSHTLQPKLNSRIAIEILILQFAFFGILNFAI